MTARLRGRCCCSVSRCKARYRHETSLNPPLVDSFHTAFETMQLYRPRVMIHGERGMGQRVLGSAVLHHLEGYHVQNLDLASLLGQSTGVSHVVWPTYASRLTSPLLPDRRDSHRPNVRRSQTPSAFRALHPQPHRVVQHTSRNISCDGRGPAGQLGGIRAGSTSGVSRRRPR